MFLNSQESLDRARAVHQRYGSWAAARKEGVVKNSDYKSDYSTAKNPVKKG